MNTYFREKNHETKKKFQNFKTVNTILESIDSILIIRAASTALTLSITGIGLTVLSITAGIEYASSLDNKILHKMIIIKNNEQKIQNEEDQQTIKSFDNLYKKFTRYCFW